jgi:hypothetical protein
MPLKPHDVHNYALNQRVKVFQEICGLIDETLTSSYDGERPITVEVTVESAHAEDKVLFNMVEKTYDAIGWNVSDGGKNIWHFEEKEAPATTDFTLPASRGPYR